MMKHIEEPSIIVMDNASYHCTTSENYPKSNTKKSDIQQWLTNKSIDFSPLETLCELRERVKNVTSREKNYELDEIALQMGHSVVPLYHCQYNPIEFIWAQINNKVVELNTTFKLLDVTNYDW